MAVTISMSLAENLAGFLQSGVAPLSAAYHGSVVDIVGTGFGTRPTFGFAGGKAGRIEKASVGADTVNSGGFFLSYERPKEIVVDEHRGKVWKSVVWDGNPATADNGTIAYDIGQEIPSGGKIFFHAVTKVNCDATQFQWKFYRQEADYSIQDGGPEWYTMFWKKTVGRYFGVRPMVAAGSAVTAYLSGEASSAIKMDGAPEWFSLNYYDVVGSENTENGINYGESTAESGTTQLFDINNSIHIDVGVTQRPRWKVLQNYLGSYLEGDPTIGEIYVDDFYVQWATSSDDLVRAVISSSATYSARTDDEIQYPSTGWTDTNAQIVVNTGGLSNGVKYVHIVKDKNTVMQTTQITIVSAP